MSKHTPPPAALAPANVNLPALTKGKRGNALLLLKRFTELADDIVESWNDIRAKSAGLEQWRYTSEPVPAHIDRLPDESDLELSEWDIERLKEAKATLAALDDGVYEEDDEGDRHLRSGVIAQRLSLMLARFPSGGPASPEKFAAGLVEHVVAADITHLALHTGCAAIEETRSSYPTITVVLEALRQHDQLWRKRLNAINRIEHHAADAVRDLRYLRGKIRVQTSRRELDAAHFRYGKARRELVVLQGAGAKVSQLIEGGFADLMRCEAEVENAFREHQGNAALEREDAEVIDEQQERAKA